MTGLQRQLVFALVAVNVGIHFGDLSTWVPSLGLTFIAWRWVADQFRIACPGRWGAAILGAMAAVAIFGEYSTLIGDPASTALLVIMISLKTFEVRGYRDLMILTYLCLLLLMSKLLSSQSMAMTIFMIADVTAILAVMHLHNVPVRIGGLPWRRSVWLLVKALPLVVLMFFFFPRFNFNLFRREPDNVQSVGFSGLVRPGGVARLARSNQIAFRAFLRAGVMPPLTRRYWRGAVLEVANDLNWDPAPVRKPVGRRLVDENQVDIMVEEGSSDWVFTLDWPSEVIARTSSRQADLFEGPGMSFGVRSPLTAREIYSVMFNPTSRQLEVDRDEIARSLKIDPPQGRIKDLVEKLRGVSGNPNEAVAELEKFITEGRFLYSLSPPAVETLEQFLFSTRAGFCEHYAGAVATLLRHLKVPARVVVGYQGGVPSVMGDYLLVYQRDAHAWVEYFNRDLNRWMRLDPTVWVAADRIALGGQPFFEQRAEAGLPAWQTHPLTRWIGPDWLRWISRGRLYFDQAEVLWLNFMLRYDFDYQRELLAKVGFSAITRSHLAGLLLVLMAVFMAGAMGVTFWRSRTRLKPEQLLYRRLAHRLGAAGLPRAKNEGPLDYLKRAQGRFPAAAQDLGELFDTIIALRYGGQEFEERHLGLVLRKMAGLKLNSARQD